MLMTGQVPDKYWTSSAQVTESVERILLAVYGGMEKQSE